MEQTKTNKEESLALINMEIEGAEEYGTDTDLLLKVLNSVKARIEDDKMSYDDFIEDLRISISEFPEETDSREDRIKLINDMYVKMLDKYAEQ